MDPIVSPTDTFSTTFSTDNFGPAPTSQREPGSSASPIDLSASQSPTAPPAPSTTKSPTTGAQTNGIPTAAAAGAGKGDANPRSCVTCRKRKVKCDKKRPCSNCARASVECVFPKPGRAPRRPRKPQDAELLARLRRLEGVVQKLGKSGAEAAGITIPDGIVGNGKAGSQGDPVSPDEKHGGVARKASAENGDVRKGSCTLEEKKDPMESEDERPGNFWPYRGPPRSAEEVEERVMGPPHALHKEFGKLVINEGKSRYVSNSLWAGLTMEVFQHASCSASRLY